MLTCFSLVLRGMAELRKIHVNLIQLCFESAFAIALLILNILRIFNIPITIDETGYQKNDSYSDLIHEKLGHANNHIFHSLLRKFFAELFTTDVFFLRLDSLIAQVLYLIYTWLICRLLFTSKWRQVCGFIILNVASPFLFEFWGLSRGYGLSLTCMTISIYFLLRYIDGRHPLFLCLCYLGAILSVYSNFSLLNYFVTVFSVITLQNFLFRDNSGVKGSLLKQIAISVLSIGLLALLISVPLINIYHFGELSFMGNKGFIKDTLRSLVSYGLGMPNQADSVFVRSVIWFIILSTWLITIYWIVQYLHNRKLKIKPELSLQYGVLTNLLLITPFIAIIAQHVLFKINYVTDRAALFFIPLYFISFIYTLSYSFRRFQFIGTSGILILTLLLAGNFIWKCNITYTSLWWFDSEDIHVLNKILDESKNKKGKIKIHLYWIFGGGFYYDVNKYYPDKFENPNWDNMPVLGQDTSYDYYYVVSTDNTDTLALHYRKVSNYLWGGSTLYKKIDRTSSLSK
jgi:hypothetical protein